jgi:hypothetical protein
MTTRLSNNLTVACQEGGTFHPRLLAPYRHYGHLVEMHCFAAMQLSGREEEEAAAGLAEQLAAADLRRRSLEKRNALLEGFIGLTPPPQQVPFIPDDTLS